jgi:hypothetical protein
MAERLAKNEAFFRESNEILRREAATRGARRADFICECAMSGCMERLPISQQAYELVRLSGSDQFIVVPGHEELAVERVTETRDGFGEAAKVARETDPR